MAKQDIVAGTTGAIIASGFNCDVDAWAADTQVNVTTWRTFASAWLKRANVSYAMTGQFSGTIQFNDANAAPMPASTGGGLNATAFESVSLTLTATTGCTYTGTANIEGVNLSRPSTGRMTGTFRFGFIGQPTQTWDETGA